MKNSTGVNDNKDNNKNENCICSLWWVRGETIYHTISECSNKLAKKVYTTRNDWVDNVIHLELCKKFKFYITSKRYMHNQASLRENVTHEFHWDFEIQTDHLISASGPDQIIMNQKKKKRELAELYTLPSLLKVKRKISPTTLLGNRKTYGLWKWQLHQLQLVLLVQSPAKDW